MRRRLIASGSSVEFWFERNEGHSRRQLNADTRREATREIADGQMSQEQDQIKRRVIRWVLIVGAVIVIVGVNVNNLRENLFSTGPVAPGRASGDKSATIAEKWHFAQSGPVSAA